MKNFMLLLVVMSLITTGCVDDFKDARPDVPLDAPAIFDTVGTGISSTDRNGDTFIYVTNGGEGTIVLTSPDSPGLLGDVSVTLSNSVQPTDIGATRVDAFSTVEGQSAGTFNVVYEAPTLGAGETAEESISIVVSDSQTPPKSVTVAREMKTVGDATCFASRPLVGFYTAVTSGIDGTDGSAFTDLTVTGQEIYLLVSQGNHPGFVRITDGSFGLYGVQGFAGNFVNITVCDNAITDMNEEFAGMTTGTLNEDGTITITWANTFGDSGTTVLTPE